MADKNELPQNFGGDCVLLQERLRRFIELKGGEIKEHRGGSVESEMTVGDFLTLYPKPRIPLFSEPLYGDIFFSRRKYGKTVYITARCAQALYEELNIAIKEMEEKED